MNLAPGTRAYTAMENPSGTMSVRGTSNGAPRIDAGTFTETVVDAPGGT
ncbi:MAG TPA: hypothetical protein VFE93_04110 [Myxococcaceae bacterium]|nr:hypothetical protein [Myxococcaceae bacterium]